jgi:spermidine dehydrogenase
MAGEQCWTDRSLGMDRPINRRDFLNGVAVAIGSIGTGLTGAGPVAMQAGGGWPQDLAGSGLSAGHFYRSARPDAKILILDNHDDFGGHAKRNEFYFG